MAQIAVVLETAPFHFLILPILCMMLGIAMASGALGGIGFVFSAILCLVVITLPLPQMPTEEAKTAAVFMFFGWFVLILLATAFGAAMGKN